MLTTFVAFVLYKEQKQRQLRPLALQRQFIFTARQGDRVTCRAVGLSLIFQLDT
jgi:hypothetical protein